MRTAIVLLSLLAFAAPASAAQQDKTSGAVRAVLAATSAETDQDGLFEVHGLTLRIDRAGVTARPTAALNPCLYYCGIGDDESSAGFADLSLNDLDGDGDPEVVVQRSGRGDVCCSAQASVLWWDGAGYRETDARLGSTFSYLRDGVIAGDDIRFYTRYAPRVGGTALPPRLWRFSRGTFTDVTREHPAEVRGALKDFAGELKLTDRAFDRHVPGARLGIKPQLAAYVATQRLLGPKAGDKRLDAEVARGRVTTKWAALVRRDLAKLRY